MRGLALVALAFAGPVAAQHQIQPDNAGGLAKMCEMAIRSIDQEAHRFDNEAEAGFCFGYLEADAHVQLLVPAPALKCIPAGVTLGQRARVLAKWAEEHPEKHHVPKLIGLRMALMDAFPCPTNSSP